jgi:DNA-binding CsgD family transcriptional regulator
MATVSSQDLRAALRFLEAAYEVAADSEVGTATPRGTIPRLVLRELESLIPARLVESFEIAWDVQDPPHTTARDEQPTPAAVEATMALHGTNPLSAFAWHPGHGPLRLSGIMPRRRLHGLSWHRYYLQPMRIQDQLKVWLWRTDRTAACVSLDRDDGDFSDRDVAVLAILQQHLATIREGLIRAPVDDGRIERLTVREAQVLSWAARGRRNREIADILVISPETVRKHLQNAYAKLGVRNRVEAIAALRGGTQEH